MENKFEEIKEKVKKEKTAVDEILKIYSSKNEGESEKEINNKQIDSLKEFILEKNKEILLDIEKITLNPKIKNHEEQIIKIPEIKNSIDKIPKRIVSSNKYELQDIDINTLKRLKKKEEKKKVKRERKASKYVSSANKMFSRYAERLVNEPSFDILKRDLIKSNLPYLIKSYISIVLFTTFLSLIFSIFVMIFFLFFNLSSEIPFILSSTTAFSTRFLNVIWIPFLLPVLTFIIMYAYPSLEKASLESRLNNELPFATIHMSAISGANIDPAKIFEIIVSTKEYPILEKEFNKIMNDMNIFGRDLITALKESSVNCPSKKLAELFNGIVTTITSGGNLSEFFDKRASSLLFDYRLDREKETKSAETFMDIYISVVIAAPMILMLLLIMMKISGIGISLSTGMITFIISSAVAVVNIGFLTLLQMKQKK